MKIRMDSEDGDNTWFTSLRFDGPVQDHEDWAFLISCFLKGPFESKVDIIDELINQELELFEMRCLKIRLDERIEVRSANMQKAMAESRAQDEVKP